MRQRLLFTVQQIDAMQLPDGKMRYERWDTEVPELLIRVSKTYKAYFALARSRKGIGRKKRLGTHPEMSPEEARKAARLVTNTGNATDPTQHGYPTEMRGEDELLTTQEAAALTKMSVAWYEKKRWDNQGPPYRRRGRIVRYLRSELMAWWLLKGDE